MTLWDVIINTNTNNTHMADIKYSVHFVIDSVLL